jgi:hypothetical protein
MRQTTRALALAGLGVLWLARAATPATGVADDIRRTTDQLFQGGSSEPGDVHTTLRHLLDIAAGLGREARLPAAAQAKLDAASAEARRLSPLDKAVRAAAAEAYGARRSRSPRRSGRSSRRRRTAAGRWTVPWLPCRRGGRRKRPGSSWGSSSS